MREIKFRCWQKRYNEGQMLYLTPFKQYYDYENGFVYAFSEGYSDFWAHENYKNDGEEFEVMQYTGLKDKNGKEIYEGDIVESKTLWGDAKIKGTVSFTERGMWMVTEIDPKWSETEFLYELVKHPDRTEIIGNIYENKNLLPEGSNSD